MANIYRYETGDAMTEGLQGSVVSDEAEQIARELARERGYAVVLEDDGDFAVFYPGGRRRRMSPAEAREGGWTDSRD